MKKTKHPGFKTIKEKIAAQNHISFERAGAILASAGRNSSAKAHKKNPRLNRIKGK